MKIRDYDLQTPPSPVNIPPLHLYALISGLPEKSRAAAAHLSPRPPSEGIVVQSLSHV